MITGGRDGIEKDSAMDLDIVCSDLKLDKAKEITIK